jgi:predicted AAA+ superfamily ATPase
MNLHDILLAQRIEREAFGDVRYIERSSVVEPEAAGRIRVVVGPRRAGKSSYALRRTVGEDGGWGYANLDDERLGALEDNDELVAIELFRQQLRGKSRVFFWKDPHGIEADFVVQEGHAIQRILQVCLDTADPKTRQREVRGLCKASRELGCRDLLLLTENEEARTSESWEGAVYPVRSMPIWKWLLAAESAASS